MNYRFTLYDYTNSDGSIGTEITEPVGFDALILALKRHPSYKSCIAEISLNTLEVTDVVGVKIINEAYEKAGINAKVNLIIDYECEECEDCFDRLLEMQLMFALYEEQYSDYCNIKVGLEQIGCRLLWKQNEDVKVNLESLTAFDGTTTLQPYEYLGKEIELPSKAILFTDIALVDEIDETEPLVGHFSLGGTVGGPGPTDISAYFHCPFPLVTIQELEEFNPLTIVPPGGTALNIDDNYFFKSQKNDTFEITGNIRANINHGGFGPIHNQTKIQIWKKNTGSDILLHEISLPQQDGIIIPADPFDTYLIDQDINVDFTNTFSLTIGDKLVIVLKIHAWTDGDGYSFSTGEVSFKKENRIKITNIDKTESTLCKQFMINEVFSRIVESSTNSCLRVYSDYLGRTDSQPYQSLVDGCGSLTALTKGLFIRRINKAKTEDTQPIFSVSFKEVFDAINSIENIGCTPEPDPNRPGYERIRIEDADFFYNDTLVLDLGDVSLIKKISSTEIYNIFKFGYDKWEAEEYNGLDEFLTKREYKTDLVNKAVFERICKFIASGYAIEITRRQGNDTSKDWRYDNDTFVVCMQRDGSNIVVEQGNITGAENIIDPSSILNYRISPIRNAMRWIRDVFKGYKNQSNAKTDFTSGDGNYYAKGRYTGNSCNIEGIIIAENDTISKDKFADVTKALPYIQAETDVINEYPLSHQDYKKIIANPNGTFTYNYKGQQHSGFLYDFKYKPEKGTADIILLPKI